MYLGCLKMKIKNIVNHSQNKGFTLLETLYAIVILTYVLMLCTSISKSFITSNIDNDLSKYEAVCSMINIELNENDDYYVLSDRLVFTNVYGDQHIYRFGYNYLLRFINGHSEIIFDNIDGSFYVDRNIIYMNFSLESSEFECSIYVI